jgi:hypothetical protein
MSDFFIPSLATLSDVLINGGILAFSCIVLPPYPSLSFPPCSKTDDKIVPLSFDKAFAMALDRGFLLVFSVILSASTSADCTGVGVGATFGAGGAS